MPLYETRVLGQAKLKLFTQMKSQISFSDFCLPAGTIEFSTDDGFLDNPLCLIQIAYPGYELEVKLSDGMVFIRRNQDYQHSEQYKGNERCHVAVQWDSDSIACGVMPESSTEGSMNQHMRAVRTPFTLPPLEFVRMLRTENLLFNAAYRNVDDLFVTVLDCLHLCEQDIRRHGCERFAFGKNGDRSRPLDEPEISRFVAGYLSSHGAARNFEVTCEPIAGSGNIDFYVLAPIHNAGLGKVAIEAKKAESPHLVRGFEVQLPQYMRRIGTTYGVYLTYWLRSDAYPYPEQHSYPQLEIEKLHPVRRPPTVRTIGLDLSYGATPSKHKE
jgi:hypothetical protein